MILYVILITNTAHSQFTEVINSNRPGFSESPYSVGSGVYQLETSFFYTESKMYPTFSVPKSLGTDFLFRTSFLKDQLEFNINLSIQKDQVSFQNIFNSIYNTTGIEKFTIAAKYLVYEPKYDDKSKEIRSWVKRNSFDWKRFIPSVAPYVGMNTDMLNDIYRRGGISPKVGVLLQQEISNDFNIITNVYYDYIGTENPELSYIITATYNFGDRWSTFFENQTRFDRFQHQNSVGSGIAYLFNRNLQINNSLRLLTNVNSYGFYGSFGISYRFNRHVDKVINLNKSEKSDKSYEDKNKGFFGRLLRKATNLFKNKGKRKSSSLKIKSKQSINKNSVESLQQNSKVNQNESIRVRPKRIRVKPTKIKTNKSQNEETQKIESKKGLFGIFKEKRKNKKKEQKIKDTEKGADQLEREIKKLEREIKKDELNRKKEQKRLEKKSKKKKKKNDE